MWPFKKKQEPVQALCDLGNYKVCVETENYAVIQPQIKQLTFQQALMEFEMLRENVYAVLCWLDPNDKLLCKKTRSLKNERT